MIEEDSFAASALDQEEEDNNKQSKVHFAPVEKFKKPAPSVCTKKTHDTSTTIVNRQIRIAEVKQKFIKEQSPRGLTVKTNEIAAKARNHHNYSTLETSTKQTLSNRQSKCVLP
jgi:hypothetical protein